MNYDYSNFHKDCGAGMRGLASAPDGLHVYCLKCGVSANLEAIAGKVSSQDACKVGDTKREVIGDQSYKVDKGAAIA